MSGLFVCVLSVCQFADTHHQDSGFLKTLPGLVNGFMLTLTGAEAFIPAV